MTAHGATLLHGALGCGDQDQNSHDPQRILGQNGEAHGAALSPVAAGPCSACSRAMFSYERVSTLTSPPTRAPYDPGEATTCVPSVVYGLGVTRRPCKACSAHTSPSFPCFHQIVKLAAHA